MTVSGKSDRLTVVSEWHELCYNKLMPKHLVPVLSLIAAVILLVMLNFTTPVGVGPFGVLVFFTTFYVLIFGIALGIVKLLARMLDKVPGRKEYFYSAAIAFGPITLLLVQSVGLFNPLSVFLVILMVALICLLINKKITA